MGEEKSFDVEVRINVRVSIDPSKFDETFMSEFRRHFYPFTDVEDHVMHLAQLEARGVADDFIEGYGPAKDMGIALNVRDWDTEIQPSESSQ